MQTQHTPPNNSIGALMRQNLESLPQDPPKIPTKKAYKYPFLDKEAINHTIQNAKKFAAEYNKAQAKKSEGIKKINHELRLDLKATPHTAKQKLAWLEYKQKEKLAKLEPMEYNQKVLAFNREHGANFLMRTYHALKNEIAITFSYLVCFYAAQVRANNARKLSAGVTTAGTLPRMLTNSENIKRYKIEDVPQCPLQNDAILTHVHNLVAAGVLINYKSHGRNMGFSVDFNPEILAIKDQNTTKKQTPDGQPIIKFKTAKPTYSDSITRTCKHKYENKGDRNGPEKGPTAATGNTYKATKSEDNPNEKPSDHRKNSGKSTSVKTEKQDQSKLGAGSTSSGQAENYDHPSDKLEAKIQATWPLCVELSENQHIHHIPLSRKALEWEARKGVMSQPQFRELLFQEFMKVISRLKRKNQSAAGAFYRAFEELDDMKLKTFTGRYFTKAKMLEEFEKWLWMVNHAEKKVKENNWRLLFINDYLDTNRRDGKEVGFWYLEKMWNKNEKQKADRKKKRQENQKAHKARKAKIKQDRVEKFGYRSIKPGTNAKSLSDYEKARKAVRKYLKSDDPNRWEHLIWYVDNNLSKTIKDGIGNLIEAETENLNKYRA